MIRKKICFRSGMMIGVKERIRMNKYVWKTDRRNTRKNRWNIRKIRNGKCILLSLALWIGCLFLLAGCGEQEEEIPLGRYTEREVPAPASGVGFAYAHPLPDGGYYLYGDGIDRTKAEPDGTSSAEGWGWQNSVNIGRKTEFAIADSGATVFEYFPKFYTEENQDQIVFYYYYVDADGDRRPLELQGEDYRSDLDLSHFSFAPDERLYAEAESWVYRVNVENGALEKLFETVGDVDEFAYIGDTMIAIDDEKAYLYDMSKEELLEENSVLSEFVVSHHPGGKILLAVKETDADNNPVLYLGCRSGLYRYVWGGSVIEQIADGRLLTLGNSQYTPLALQILPEEEFRVFFSGNRIVELYYDENIPARPSRELTIYSLEENGMIRYAGQLFGQEHPDVLVNYETGMDGDNAVSKEDAIKNLNTRLLAGETPDILILDDMDMEQYAQKGILKAMDDFLSPYEEEGVLYQNIIEGMRMTENDSIYGVPMTVYLPLWYSEKKYLDGEQGLSDLVAGAKKARADHPEGPLLSTPYPRDLLNELIPVCLPAWTDEDGALQEDKIEEFYQAMQRLWELDSAGLPGDARMKWQQGYMEEWDYPEEEKLLRMIYGGGYNDYNNIGESWMVFCYMENSWQDMQQVHVYPRNIREGYIDKAVTDEVVYEKLIGQADNVYWAENIVGLCEQAKEPELAEEFMELLLSERMMNKWWLNGVFETGVTIRKDSLENILDINNNEYAEVAGWNSQMINTMYHEAVWPDEKEKQWLYQMMEDADCCYRSGTMLGETAKEVGLQVLDGSLTPEEGAKEVAKRMAIEMEE